VLLVVASVVFALATVRCVPFERPVPILSFSFLISAGELGSELLEKLFNKNVNLQLPLKIGSVLLYELG
jgi:hypothetical protein